MSTDTEAHEALLREAEEARTKLLGTIVRLDGRRHEATNLSKQIGPYLRHLRVAGVAVAIAATGLAALAVHGVVDRARRRRGDRWRLAKNFWHHPDRELRAERRPFAVEVVRSLLFTLVTTALALPLRRAVREIGGLAEPRRADRS
jgi:hypothetical protein